MSITIKNISNLLTTDEIKAILDGGREVKFASPSLTPTPAGFPDYEFTAEGRVLAGGEDAPVFYDATTAYVDDNMPKFVLDGVAEDGVIIKIPVYGAQAKYVTLMPGDTLTLETKDAVAEKFYEEVVAALAPFGEEVGSGSGYQA